MAFDVSQFISQLQSDGARPNLFEIILPFPPAIAATGGAGATQKLSFMARASHLPGLTQGVVGLYYFGREVKLAGNRTYPDWTITVINDEDFQVRIAFERWLAAINSPTGNIRSAATPNLLTYSTTGTVNQYSKTGEIIKTYSLVQAWPTDISQIDLDWSQNDSIEEWSATLNYQYWIDTTNGIV